MNSIYALTFFINLDFQFISAFYKSNDFYFGFKIENHVNNASSLYCKFMGTIDFMSLCCTKKIYFIGLIKRKNDRLSILQFIALDCFGTKAEFSTNNF